MTTFTEFRDGVGGEMAHRLGVDISGCPTWRAFTTAMVAFNDTDAAARLVKAARAAAGFYSTGEKALLVALLVAADFAWLADEIAGPNAWERLTRCDDRHSRAIAAVILRQDAGPEGALDR